jgi:hypothetical protein
MNQQIELVDTEQLDQGFEKQTPSIMPTPTHGKKSALKPRLTQVFHAPPRFLMVESRCRINKRGEPRLSEPRELETAVVSINIAVCRIA